MIHPVPVVEVIEGIHVVRDDYIPGGTKARVIHTLFDDHEEYVYAGPCQGYAQVALAFAAKQRGKRATLFCAKRNVKHQRTLDALAAGAVVIEVHNGYLTVVQHQAELYCQRTGAALLPFGIDTPEIRKRIADVARSVSYIPEEVWTVGGSGTLSMSLQQAWPLARFNVVQIGRELKNVGRARIWIAPERFENDAKEPPPFASCGNYDAKAWRFIKQHATPGALFWNVAGG